MVVLVETAHEFTSRTRKGPLACDPRLQCWSTAQVTRAAQAGHLFHCLVVCFHVAPRFAKFSNDLSSSLSAKPCMKFCVSVESQPNKDSRYPTQMSGIFFAFRLPVSSRRQSSRPLIFNQRG